MTKSFSSKLLCWSTVLYIISLPVQYPAVLPFISDRIKLPELVGLAMIALLVMDLLINGKSKDEKFLYMPDFFGIALIAGSLISALLSGITFESFLEAGGLAYLFLIYYIIRRIVVAGKFPLLLNSFVVSAAIAGALGIIGSTLAFLSIDTPLALAMHPYPYLGYIARARALTTHPTMLANILMFGIILTLGVAYDRKKIIKVQAIFLAVMVIALLFTLSKSFVSTIAAMLIMILILHWKNRKIRIFLLSSLFMIVTIFQVMTHFYFVTGFNDKDMDKLVEWNSVSGERLGEFHNLKIYPTSYLVIKKMEIEIFRDMMISGTGPGRYNERVRYLQGKGLYPSNFEAFDPHSSYFGILVEQGMVGVAFLVLAVIFLVKTIAGICSPPLAGSRGVCAALAGIIIIMANEAMVTDIMNFRQLWVILGLTAGLWILDNSLKPGSKSS